MQHLHTRPRIDLQFITRPSRYYGFICVAIDGEKKAEAWGESATDAEQRAEYLIGFEQ